MTSSLRILDPRADSARDRRDARTLTDAQALLDAGRVADARTHLAPLAAEPVTAIRAQAALLLAGLALMDAEPAETLALIARIPAALVVDGGYRSMIKAAALRQLRRYPEALAEAERATAMGLSTARLLVLADAQKHAGKLDGAIGTLEQLLLAQPDDATALAQLAGFHNLARNTSAADAVRARFEAVAPPGAESELSRAFFFLTRGAIDDAFACLARAAALAPALTRAYIDDEIELDALRDDARLVAIVAR